MITLTLNEAAQAVNARNYQTQHGKFSGCSIDSRNISEGNLFIALKGENYDGHNFIADAEQQGAAALMLERDDIVHTKPAIIVENSLSALGALAKYWRSRLKLPIIAVTGSNGKTTVKEMIKHILGQAAHVHATHANQNNEIGVPLTLLGLNAQHQFAVIEMGANHLGEIERLSHITQPNIAVITQCAPAHLEGFGSLESVARAKSEIFSGLKNSGIAVINADDQFADFWRKSCPNAKQISFGTNKDADVYVVPETIMKKPDGVEFSLSTGQASTRISLPIPGRHNIYNVMAATSCVLNLGVSLNQIQAAMQTMPAVQGRLNIKQGKNNSLIIDDTYNANARSLDAALDVLVTQHGRHYLVLGDMMELGDTSEAIHRDIGCKLQQNGCVDRLFTIGALSAHASNSFGDNAKHYQNHEMLYQELLPLLEKNVTVLLKGSRAMQLEKIANKLIEQE